MEITWDKNGIYHKRWQLEFDMEEYYERTGKKEFKFSVVEFYQRMGTKEFNNCEFQRQTYPVMEELFVSFISKNYASTKNLAPICNDYYIFRSER